MATLNFPDAPDTGDIYFDSNSGFTYEWNGTVWISRDPSTIPNIKELDNISGSFNGSTATFNLTVSSVAVTPATAQQLIINIGNVMQNPGDDYTVSGSTITFTTAPISGLGFQGTLLGTGVSLGTVVDGSVSPSSLDTSDSYNVGGITVTGITTVTDFTISGITTVANLEPADMDISGIGTVSNIIMTKDAAGLGATMGAAVGVVTYFGDGSNLTGLGLTFFPISYDPGISSTNIPVSSNITLDWNHPIKAGSGTITIRSGSASGTVVDQFVVGTSSSISFVNNQVILDPAADLSDGIEYFVTFPAGTIKSYGDKYQNDQLIYSFTSIPVVRELWGSGNLDKGALGLNTAYTDENVYRYSSPVQLPGTTWTMATTGTEYTIASKTDGTLWVMGYNQWGNLGLSDTIQKSSPVQLPGTTWETGFGKFSSGVSHVGAVKTDGTLWIWGKNRYGGLGLNQSGPSSPSAYYSVSSPTQLPGTDWSKVGSWGYDSSLAIKTNGQLWAWGHNDKGQAGQNDDNVGYSSPVQVGTDTTWSTVSCGDHTAGGIKTDGTLWLWGGNNYGRLGQNNLTDYSSPVQIPGTTWTKVMPNGGGSGYTLATKTDGTLWSWGYQYYGVLGQNQGGPGLDYSSPVQIPGTTWNNFIPGSKRAFATKTDGTLWNWGNTFGLGGNAYLSRYSSPVQVPGTDYTWLMNGSIQSPDHIVFGKTPS